jgi:hypothetical protein
MRIKFNSYFRIINKKYSDNPLKIKMISKKYINHNTFVAEYIPQESNTQIQIPTAMHVSIM